MSSQTDSWPSSPSRRNEIANHLAASASELTTAAMKQFGANHSWFTTLDAEHRSWISLVARAGIDSFVAWLRTAGEGVATREIFDAAPRALMRFITLHQTVDLVRTTIDTVEESIDELLPEPDHELVHMAIVYFSREIAFDAASVYARAAEMRGLWDERLESFVVDAVIRGDADESILSRAAALGWHEPSGVVVVIGPGRDQVEAIRTTVIEAGFDVLASPQGDRSVVIIGGRLDTPADAVKVVTALVPHFADGPIVIGPVVAALDQAYPSARAALSGFRAAGGWPTSPRPTLASELLPERALSGDGHARRSLAHDLYVPINAHQDLISTLDTFFECDQSIEATARELFIHANTVRYRLNRVYEVSGHDPRASRDAYILRMALTLGRLLT